MANTNVGIRVVVLGAAEAHRQVGALRNDLTRFAATMDAASAGSAAFGRSLVRAGDAVVSFGRTLTFGVTAPILALTGTLIKAGIDFEQAFVGVAKTVDGVAKGFNEIATEMYGTTTGLNDLQKQAVFTNEEFGKLTDFGEKLSDQFIDLSLNIPIAATELARIGQVSGQLGVSASQIENFTETIAKLSVTTDLSSEAAAFAIARVANIMGIESEKMAEFAGQFGAAIVALGNNAAATEPEIVNLTLRLAAAGRIAGLTTPDILGLSTSLAEMGVRAERGGTAVSRVIYEMIFAISDGGDALDTFAQIAGLSAQEFATRFKTDALGTLELFLTRLADAQDAGRITKDTLLELGLSGIRVREVLNLLGPNIELVRNNVALANMQWQEQIALQEEFVKQSKTIRNQLQLIKNSFMALGVEVLKDLRDDIERIITGIRNLIQRFIDLDPAVRQSILRFGLLIATFGPALLVIGTLTQLAGNAAIGLTKLSGAFRGLLALPFTPLLGIFGLFFGGGKGKDKKGGLLSGLTRLIPKPQSFAKDIKGILTLIPTILMTATRDIGKAFSTIISGALNLAFKGINLLGIPAKIAGLFSKVVSFVLSFIPGVGPIISKIFDTISSPVRNLISGVFGKLGTVFKNTFGIFGTLITGTAKRIPVFGASLVSFILKPLKAIPSLIAVAAAGFTLLFAPKVITQAVKNWDKLLAEFKLSFTNFTEDLKREGIERALLLFVSGGSLGSGRQGGILGIARALGASEENARKFSYALGTATSHAIQIYKATVAFVKFLINGVTNSLKLEKSVGSTSDRIIALTTAIAQFLGGFFVGWTSSFGDMAAAFDTFIRAVKDAFSSFGALFSAVFGSAQKTQDEFINQLEPDFESTASNIGKTAGEILGQIVSFALQGFALIANITAVVVDAFTSLVTAYKEGGLKGVFEELGPTLKTIWDGIILAAGTLWDTVKPSLESFVNSAVSWLQTDGVSLLAAGVSSIGSVVKDAFEDALFGREQRQFFMTTPSGITREIPDYGDAQRRKGLKQAGFDLSSDLVREGGLVESLGELITQMYNYIASEEVKGRIVSGFNILFTGVGNFFSNDVWPILQPHLQTLWDIIENWFETQVAPRFKAVGRYLINQFVNGILDVLTYSPLLHILEAVGVVDEKTWSNLLGLDEALGLSKPLQDLMDDELGKVSPISPQTQKAMSDNINQTTVPLGMAIIDGLNSGLDTSTPTLTSTLNSIASKAVSILKTAWLAYSPSRIFMAIGQDVMLGLIYGMQSYQTYLQSVLNSILYQFDIFSMGITNSTTSVTTQLMNFYNTASTLLTLISGAVSSAFSFLTGTAPTAGSSESNVNYNTYSPQFVGPQPSSTYMQNQQMYSQYLLAQQAVG